jgi:DNA-binding MarR family transcriptional regulator
MLDGRDIVAHNVAVAQLSQMSTVDQDSGELAAVAVRVEVAARALLSLSARASMELPGEVSLTQLRALAAAEEAGPCSLGVLAEALQISTSSASRLVDRLTAAGVLDRRPSDISRRELILQVTPRGRRLLRRHETTRQAVFAEALRGMPAADVRALVRGLEAVQQRLDAAHEPHAQ